MKRLTSFRKCLEDEKERIVALYGVDITQSLFHEYYEDLHSMDMKGEYMDFYSDLDNKNLEKSLAKDSLEDFKSLNNYEKELSSDSESTN